MKKTIVHLVAASPAGLSGKQLGELIGLSPQSFLYHFRNCPGLTREKHDGVFIYFSDTDAVFERQVQQRSSLVQRSALITISDSEAILILVAVIRQHGISAQEILNLPEIKKSKMKLSSIQGFMVYHGLYGTFRSGSLRNLVPKGGTFGFDIIVEVGFALFIHCRCNQEVMADLAMKNVFMSEREVSFLGRKFIIYLALAHRKSQ